MTRPAHRLLLALALAGAAATVAARAPLRAAPRSSPRVLALTNAERGREISVPIAPGEPFFVTYHHSMYEQPVTEEFVVDPEGAIVLRAVSSPSAAVREYFGITAAGERHPVVRVMAEIVFRVAAGTPQRLSVRGVERSFLEVGEHGDRVVLRSKILPERRDDAPPLPPPRSLRSP
jgi:hypothetical protein